MQVIIQVRSVYGVNKAYPVNDTARGFATIAGTKTLARSALHTILGMGIEVLEVNHLGYPVTSYAPGKTGALSNVA